MPPAWEAWRRGGGINIYCICSVLKAAADDRKLWFHEALLYSFTLDKCFSIVPCMTFLWLGSEQVTSPLYEEVLQSQSDV